ncbi:MAG: N5-carboxyaminoimidazole ribonucleotide synthase [Isosphaeraceae bacterium]|jgi:5-(carboxyamino)imidazole ribonucleotide synthase|nr:MAG: N5-carboxyaminoimidazole ribonucleotide synthase [Isosphaeraceae bacterium]
MTAPLDPIHPPARLGVLGGGQLGRMFVQAAHDLGYRTVTLTSSPDDPAAQIAHDVVLAPPDCHPGADLESLRTFAERCDAVTIEFENVHAPGVRWLGRRLPVRPGWHAVWIAQNRIREKSFLSRHGFPVPDWRPIRTQADLHRALELPGPLILKTAASGYDGRGQIRLDHPHELDPAWSSLNRAPCIVERVVPFALEISCIVARNPQGHSAVYPVFWNQHRHHILDVTVCPAPIGPIVAATARQIARRIAAALQIVGLLTVEFFVTPSGDLLVNELAPRPHNSGHLTIEAAETSQFSQQVRALCGLPLGSANLRGPAAMANLLGDLWFPHPPRWDAALAADSAVSIHLYGKSSAKPRRKMGHLTILDADPLAAEARARAARAALQPHKSSCPPGRSVSPNLPGSS